MPRSATRLRKMIAGLRTAGLDTDEIARRAMIARGAVYRFSQGDSRALDDDFDRIAGKSVSEVSTKTPCLRPHLPRRAAALGCRAVARA